MNMGSEFNRNTNTGIKDQPAGKVEILLFLVLVSIIGACATGATYFQRSNDVAAQFEKGQVLTGYRYYVGGPTAKPNAIVALKDTYTLDSEHWTLFAATPDSLRNMVDRIKDVQNAEFKEQQMISNGARIMAGSKNQIGIWYSVYDYSQVRVLDGNRVYLSFPPTRLPTTFREPHAVAF